MILVTSINIALFVLREYLFTELQLAIVNPQSMPSWFTTQTDNLSKTTNQTQT